MKRLLLAILLFPIALLAQSGGQPITLYVADSDLRAVSLCQNVTCLGSFTKDLGMTAASLQNVSRDGVYTLQVSWQNYYGVYPGYYEAKVSLGPNELCEADGWATQKWTRVSVVCPAPGYIVFDQWPDWTGNKFDPNAHLIISLSVTGWYIYPADVSLTFTPTN